MDDVIAAYQELPRSVRPLELRIDRWSAAVVLFVTALVTLLQFPRAPQVVLSTLPLTALLLWFAMRASTRGALATWCLAGACAAGWLNVALGSALAFGVGALPAGLACGFFGLPYGFVYGLGILLLLSPLSGIDSKRPDAAERALAVTALWLGGAGLFVASVPTPIWRDLDLVPAFFEPTVWRTASAVGLAAIALASWAVPRWRADRRARWVESVQLGLQPGWCALPVEPEHGALRWLTPPSERAFVVARRIDVNGAYRSSAPRPIALAAEP